MKFDDARIAALAAYVASLGPGPAIPRREVHDVIDPARRRVAEGGEIFRVNCAMCHNFAGAGGALTRGKYAPPSRAQRQAHLRGHGVRPAVDARLQRHEPHARGEAEGHLLPQGAGERANVGGLTLGNLGPVSKGLFAWVFGLGILIGCAVWLGKKAA